jgi:hypothetical protein
MTKDEQVSVLVALAAKKPDEFRALALAERWNGLTFEAILDRLVQDDDAIERFSFAFAEPRGEC